MILGGGLSIHTHIPKRFESASSAFALANGGAESRQEPKRFMTPRNVCDLHSLGREGRQ